MALTPSHRALSPWNRLRALTEQIDDIFGVEPGGTRAIGEWGPPVDLEETENELIFTAELPGMNKDDVDIEIENGVLAIRGEKKEERKEEQKGRRYVYERQYGSFLRSFTLPRSVDQDRIRARFDNGVLTVTLPKTEQARGKRISVE